MRVFSFVDIYTNLWHSWLCIDNIEMLINIYKNYLDDAHVGNLGSMKQFMEIEKALLDENKNVIKKIGLLELEDNGLGL
jgi:hypothetical protein